MNAYIIAIDGPAGAGKSTIAGAVAQKLGLVRVNTGAIYRAVTLIALEQKRKDEEIADLIKTLKIRFEGPRVFVNDREVTEQIRTPEVSSETSRISSLPPVRAGLLDLQRQLGRSHQKGAVLEGRDIGTVVFPDAEVKIFLTASAEERARRRTIDLEAAGGTPDYEEVLEAIIQRDKQDSERDVAPLKQAKDAYALDSTGKNIDQVVEEVAQLVRKRGLG